MNVKLLNADNVLVEIRIKVQLFSLNLVLKECNAYKKVSHANPHLVTMKLNAVRFESLLRFKMKHSVMRFEFI